MCGIVGFSGPSETGLLRSMNMAQAHRGPDDAGYFEDEDLNASLGMTRLSIQDHAGGCQPMSGYSGDLNLVFNGEIFNAPEIRLELESDGFVFSSDHSDTEVLLHLYRRDGAEMLKHLNGMFAFVIFDRSRKILLGARDQTGIKPLYYSVEGARFCFSSELKSLLKAPWVRRELDRQAIYDFFTFHCIPAPRTPFLGVRKLPPGTFFEYNLEKKNLTISEYWRPSFSRSEDVPRNRSDFGVRGALAAASERWLAGDVPIGFSLSGGIDSSILVGLASMSGHQVRTFSLGFDGFPELDESALARTVAKRWSTEHHEIVLREDDLLSDLSKMVFHLDEPYAGGLPSWFIYKEMAKDVKVAVVGTGGDELFGNYGKWRPYESVAAGARKAASNFSSGASLSDLVRHPKAFFYHLHLRDFQKRIFFRSEFLAGLEASEIAVEKKWAGSGLDEARNIVPVIDLGTQLPEEFLLMTDRFSMAHSIEARTPFLDKDFVELILSIPSNLRTSKQSLKALLIEEFQDLLSPQLTAARKKGFVIPQREWLRGKLRGEVQRLFAADFLEEQGVFTDAVRENLVEPFLSGANRAASAVWTLFMFQLWYEQCFTGEELS